MVNAINTSLSGLTAAAKRVEVAANNLANQNTTRARNENGEVLDRPFIPQRVDQVSLSNGGVQTQVRDVENPTVPIFDPGSGDFTLAPNVDQAQELIALKLASYDFRANARAIEVQTNLQDSVLDILS
jgi:flagellar basal body rod protein FlgC